MAQHVFPAEEVLEEHAAGDSRWSIHPRQVRQAPARYSACPRARWHPPVPRRDACSAMNP
jgi:hypothetical protein